MKKIISVMMAFVMSASMILFSSCEKKPCVHTYGEWTVTTPPTCSEYGEEIRICLNDSTHIETRTLDTVNHSYLNGKCEYCGKEPTPTEGLEYTLNKDGESYSLTGIGTATDMDIVVASTYEGKSVTSIGNYAFYNCTSLTSLELPNSVTSIGDWAFYSCVNLTSFEIPDSVTSIGDYAFSFCDSLMSVVIPDSVTSIGCEAFSGCDSLMSVVLGESLEEIGDRAFYGCRKLIEVYNKSSLPITAGSDSYGRAGYYAKNVYTPTEGESKLSTDENEYIIYTDGEDKLLVEYTGTKTDLVVPDGITAIYKDAFYGCDTLTSIELPNSVTSIGNYAFSFCDSLTSIVIGNNVTSIGTNGFAYCNKLIEVYNKSSLPITAGSDSYGYVGYYAKNVYTPTEGERKLSTDENGYIIYTDGEDKLLVKYTGTETNLVLPDGITSIGEYAFYNCDSLTSIELPNSLTSIGAYAFTGCDSLTSLELPNSLTSIGNSAFNNCDSLMSVVIPDSVTSIGKNAFSSCDNITNIIIPDSVIEIDTHAFTQSHNLYYNKYNNGYYLGNSNNPYLVFIELVDQTATSCVIHQNTKFIYTSVFYQSGLQSIVIPNSVTSIGDWAFYSCDSLTSINFQGSMEEWNKIKKGAKWNYSTENYTVICTDGTLDKDSAV